LHRHKHGRRTLHPTRDALTAEEWNAETARVSELRAKLNGVVNVLHKRWPNGLSVHQAMGRVIRNASPITPRLTWAAGTSHDTTQMVRLRDIARRLELNRRAAETAPSHFLTLRQPDWSNSWQSPLESSHDHVTLHRQIIEAPSSAGQAAKASYAEQSAG
jgi:hypothetical protein